MPDSSRKYGIIAGALVLCAILCRLIGKHVSYDAPFSLTRTMIYIGLYIAWGITVGRRVIHGPVRRSLLAVAGLMVFWFVVRSVKYFFTAGPSPATRMLWYFYYLPMLFIPLLCLYVAIFLGKTEACSLPGWAKLLFIPTALCLLLVLTNDLHQFVFSFPAGEIWSDRNNGYEISYFLVLGWEVFCALAALALMVWKCRLAQRKKHLPSILLACSIVYALIYVSGVRWMRVIGGDITAAQCLMFTAILESCIQCGLIQTNTGYETLFEIGTLGAQIVDMDHEIRYASSNAAKLAPDVILAAEAGSVSMDKNTLLKSSPIHGGRVLWQEDIRDIAALLERLEENRKNIEDSNCLEEENYKTKMKINALREKNRLYDRLQRQTARQVGRLDELLDWYEAEKEPCAARGLLAKIGVIGAYVKRRGNLIFIGEKTGATDTAELSACLEESFTNLRLMGVECALDIPEGQRIPVAEAERVYDFFEDIIEGALWDLHSVWLKGRSLEKELLFSMEVESGAELAALSGSAGSCAHEDGVWRFTLRVRKAGEAI